MKKIIISPHIDDEVVGCGGIIDDDTFIIECGVEDRNYVNKQQRVKEINIVCEMTGAKYKLLDNIVNTYNLRNMIGTFESIINDFKPNEIYIPHPSYNQDHREVYEAAFTAVRPHDVNHFVEHVYVYEQPHVFIWNWNHGNFSPQYFVPIDIEFKIKLYLEGMSSMVREHRSVELIRALAVLRGKQSNCKYAEAYQVLRWVK